jgi:hypothetical protein
MQRIFDKSYFKDKLRSDIQLWIDTHKEQLIGSAIFTKSNGIVSKVVTWAEGWTCKDKDFCPSHTGSIVLKDNELLIFDMKPPKATTQSLEKYLWTTKEDFVIVLRDFKLDIDMFSKTILEHEGQGYPYMSAIRSVFTKKQTQWNCHCSELHLRKLQLQGLFTDTNAEITPDELLHLLEGETNDNSNS